MQQIGYFCGLGVSGDNIANLVKIEQGDTHRLAPNTRKYVYHGKLDGQEIVVKPYESRHERGVIEAMSGSHLSLVLDYNEGYVIERVARVNSAEIAYREGSIDSKMLGRIVGSVLAELHQRGVNYNHTLEDHLLVEGKSQRVIDFGELREDRNREEFINDVVNGLEYLRDTVGSDVSALKNAVEELKAAYSQGYDSSIFASAAKRHLKFAMPHDPLRILLS